MSLIAELTGKRSFAPEAQSVAPEPEQRWPMFAHRLPELRAANSRRQFTDEITCSLSSLMGAGNAAWHVRLIRGDEEYVLRAVRFPISFATYNHLLHAVDYIGVTENFRRAIDYFEIPDNELPAGFRLELRLEADRVLRLDLVRDIAYGKNATRRPTSGRRTDRNWPSNWPTF